MQQRASKFAGELRDQCLGVRIMRLHRLVSRRFDQALRPIGLTLPQAEVLAVLTLAGPLRPAALADALALERSTISRNLAAMQQKGWVSLDMSASGRATSAAITEDGTHALVAAKTAWGEAQTAVAALVGSTAAVTLDSWLDALSDK